MKEWILKLESTRYLVYYEEINKENLSVSASKHVDYSSITGAFIQTD